MTSQSFNRYRDDQSGELLAAPALSKILTSECQVLRFPAFSTGNAFALGCRIRDTFRKNERYHQNGTAGMALAITLFSGLTLYQTCVGQGVTPDNMEWLHRKSNTVKRFGVSSWLRGQQRLAKGRPADDPLLGPDFAAHGGAFPIYIEGVDVGPIGAVTISGMTQELDHELAVLCITSFIQDLKDVV
ncbi:hypothetical protein BCV69DRAFT_283721 [Microstroma glucosiphilum]|uniref:DUF336-domain-containing protein n=1 Tax=Pseudomicrostroma glucosiphilum TaxID=1684307 RepID=A0A316U2N9_9BASI|nr:hypothetical protein BCV69DRAFT_283721 [Pseudomicrostroma glucosiphilum]PWN19609.1 hypothetical protein BCV69DRAFT_283721 [Pseudomicrostroma glucosiphilum]